MKVATPTRKPVPKKLDGMIRIDRSGVISSLGGNDLTEIRITFNGWTFRVDGAGMRLTSPAIYGSFSLGPEYKTNLTIPFEEAS